MSKLYIIKAFVAVESSADYPRVQELMHEILRLPEVEKVQVFDAAATTEQLHLQKLGLSSEG